MGKAEPMNSLQEELISPLAGSEPKSEVTFACAVASAWVDRSLIFSGHMPGSIYHSGLSSMSPPPEAFPDPST